MRHTYHAAILLLSLSVALPAQQKTHIAVLDFEANGISDVEAKTLSNKLRSELFKTGTFKVIERDQMNEILKEQGFQQTGCTSQECAIEVGQMIGVKQMIAGSIGKVGQTFLISLRMIDVASGEILKMVDEDIQGAIDFVLSDGIPSVARQMAGLAKPKPTVQPKPDPEELKRQQDAARMKKEEEARRAAEEAKRLEELRKQEEDARVAQQRAEEEKRKEEDNTQRTQVRDARREVRRVTFGLGAAYSLGEINTFGGTLTAGLKVKHNFFGVNGHFGLGEKEYKRVSATGVEGDTDNMMRRIAGGGIVWYFERLNVNNVFILAPGLTAGFWNIHDGEPLERSFVEVLGAKAKMQVGYNVIFLVIESTVLFNLSKITPQFGGGILLSL